MHVGMSVFFQNLEGQRSDREIYAHELSMADLAEPLGFDSVWAAEHHFTDYDMCPSVTQFLTWVAGRTNKVGLGSMVVVLPWTDPVRVAEQFSVLDYVSDGRALLGIGRGLGRVEFEGFRVAMGESRPRFVEYAEALLTALETGTIEYEGKFYQQPRTAIRPAPFKSFRGRTYASAVSPESAEIMARLGVGIMIIAQKPWETALQEIEHYRGVYREVNRAEPPQPLLVSFAAVHESEDGAREMFERYIMDYCSSTLTHYEFANAGLADIPGYEYYGKLAQNIEKHGADRFCRFLAELQVWGTPDQVAEQMIEHQRMLDSSGVIGVFSYGGMPDDVAKANLHLFAEKVLPRLQAHDAQARSA
ncbi:MAG: LLM class flavin-dependent oxidoreductase [Proteobacteria bacterium]|nr:LLM class flavin-dependent oxidoreductase [Pseudomonadota bacterium]